MTGPGKVAIVIPTYNRADLVVEAVESALAQTLPCRVVVVDDGSTDDTLERLRKFGSRIMVLARENRERGAARNAGAAACSEADLLCFLDADDMLSPGFVADVTELFRALPDAPLVTVPAVLTDEDLRPLGTLEHDDPGPVSLEGFLLARDAVPVTGTAIRRRHFDAVGGFDERRELAGSEDWLLMARLLARGRGRRGGTATALIRKHPGNSMQNARSMEESMVLAHRIFFEEVWDEVRREPEAAALPPGIAAASRARLRTNAAAQHYGVGAMSRARSLLLAGAREDPGMLTTGKWWWILVRSLLGRRIVRLIRGWRSRRAGQRAGGPAVPATPDEE